MDYDKRWGAYRLRLTKSDIKKHSELLLRLLKMSDGLDVDSGMALEPGLKRASSPLCHTASICVRGLGPDF